jgi:hypothetical protein
MATTTPNFGWPVPTSSDLVKNGATAIEGLGDAIDASLLDLKGGTTDQVLAKNSNTDMDFKWVSDATGMTNPMTTTGDVIYSSSGSTPARLGIGTAGQVLQVNSGATAPEWATASSGTFPKLSFVTPSSNFSSSSTSYTDVTGYTITITPVSATNTIQVTANLAVQIGTSSNTEFRILVDGVAQGGRIEAPLEATEGSITVISYVSNLAASAKICKLQMRAAGGVSTTVYGSSSGYVSNFGVLEIY